MVKFGENHLTLRLYWNEMEPRFSVRVLLALMAAVAVASAIAPLFEDPVPVYLCIASTGGFFLWLKWVVTREE